MVFFVNRPFCSANSGDPDQMQHCAASHLGLCCLPISSHRAYLNTDNMNLYKSRCMDFEEANSQVNSLCGALPRDDLRMHKCI